MVDPTEHEIKALAAASDTAGEFIEKLGNPNIAAWSAEQWFGFIEAVCGGYVDSLCLQQAAINKAVARVQGGL